MANITIKDIARELGFSISTVSRALQNHPDISDETKRVVVSYAREHHYRPNQLASSLRTQRNTTIGVLLPEITAFFFSTILSGVEKAANAAGYNVLITRTKEDPDRERECLQMLCNSRVAGIIACPTRFTTDFTPYNEVVEAGIPLVIVDRKTPVRCDQIISDDFNGAFTAVEYLIQTGCKRIAMFTSVGHSQSVAERQRGYREALLHYGIPYEEDKIYACPNREDTIKWASLLLGSEESPDAVFCANDRIANALLYVAKVKHLNIPEDICICGFSNDTLTRHTDPMQTTVEQHGKRMGQQAFDIILSRIDNDLQDAEPQVIVLPTDLIVRETTR